MGLFDKFKKNKKEKKEVERKPRQFNQKINNNEPRGDITLEYCNENILCRIKLMSPDTFDLLNKSLEIFPFIDIYSQIIQICLINKQDNKQFTLEQVKTLFEGDLSIDFAMECLEVSNIKTSPDFFETKRKSNPNSITLNFSDDINQELSSNIDNIISATIVKWKDETNNLYNADEYDILNYIINEVQYLLDETASELFFKENIAKHKKYCLRCMTERDESQSICPNCSFNFKTNLYEFEDRTIFHSVTFDELPTKTLNIKNMDVEQKSSSKKAKYEYNSKELFVEEVAMEYYKNLGYNAIWSENFYWETLYSLLFWDIIFMKTDTCTQYPMDHERFEEFYDLLINSDMFDMPNDFFKANFYFVRRDAINHKLNEFKEPEVMINALNANYHKYYGKRCRGIYDWDKFKLNCLRIPILNLEKEQVLLIMDRLLHDFSYYRSGLPDLIVWDEEEFFFVEVKSKKDNLSQMQIEWHEYLLNTAKIDVKLFCVNKTDKQIDNLIKKYDTIPKKEYSFKLSFDADSLELENMENLTGEDLIKKQKELDKYGSELVKVGKEKEAKKLFEMNVKTDSPFETSYKELSRIYGNEGKYNESIEVCELGIKNVKDIKRDFFERRIDVMVNNEIYGTKKENKEIKYKVNKINQRKLEKEMKEYKRTVLKKIKENEKIAKKLYSGSFDEKTEAIVLYEENVSYSIPCKSYSKLIKLYKEREEYNKAIEILKKAIVVYSNEGKSITSFEKDLNELNDKKYSITKENTEKAEILEENGEIDEAIEALLEVVEHGFIYSHTIHSLAQLYHYKHEFENEREIYKIGIASEEDKSYAEQTYSEHLENVECYLETGKWKYDCLPRDPKIVYLNIKEAKSFLENGEKEEGVRLLEDIMEYGSYNNTVYYTLYKIYNQDNRFNDLIRVCEKAIEVLGVFSTDRKRIWTKYLEKSIKQKEKEEESNSL